MRLRRRPEQASGLSDPEGFGRFYRRQERVLLGFFMRVSGRGELALDLAAETFARAFEGRASFDSSRGGERAWLFGIARHVLADSLQRGRVQSSARARLGMAALTVEERLVASVEEAADACEPAVVEQWLSTLSPEQRTAVRLRVLDERSYEEIAGELQCSEALVRKRVSRGLALLRADLAGQAPIETNTERQGSR
jgi:RNA polymerase sigma factor (sigma-70 family)